jgi:hypothetical protein
MLKQSQKCYHAWKEVSTIEANEKASTSTNCKLRETLQAKQCPSQKKAAQMSHTSQQRVSMETQTREPNTSDLYHSDDLSEAGPVASNNPEMTTPQDRQTPPPHVEWLRTQLIVVNRQTIHKSMAT